MQPARTGQPGIQRGFENAGGIAQTTFRMFRREALQEILGRDAGPALKEPVKMRFTELNRRGQITQRGLASVVLIQELTQAAKAAESLHGITLAEVPTKPHPFLAVISLRIPERNPTEGARTAAD